MYPAAVEIGVELDGKPSITTAPYNTYLDCSYENKTNLYIDLAKFSQGQFIIQSIVIGGTDFHSISPNLLSCANLEFGAW